MTKGKSVVQFLKDISRPARHFIMSRVREVLLQRDVVICRKNYVRQIERCRDKLKRGEKLRVIFLVSELSKWKTQSLYDAMAQSKGFEPIIAVSGRGAWWKHPEYKSLTEEAVKSFRDKGMKYEVVADFKTMTNRPLEELRPNIVFYEQPYDWGREYMPISVSRFALTAYVPYYVPTNEIDPSWYTEPFFRTNFLYILLNERIKDALSAIIDPRKYSGRQVALGHTFYDLYGEPYAQPQKQKRDLVIYAPHWTFDHPNNVNIQNISTFLWNGKEILAYAKAHPEVKWLFKPHPRLQWQLVDSGVWTKGEVDAYYKEWEKLGQSYYGSDYVALFNRSRAMITDCSSFVAEYPPCGGAMIHLRSTTQKLELLRAYDKMYDSFYQVHNLKEMYKTFDMVVARGEDPKREERIKAVTELNLVGNNAAKNIMEYLLKEFGA